MLGQVPGQRVAAGRRAGDGAQVAGGLLRRGPHQGPPLGLVPRLLHGLVVTQMSGFKKRELATKKPSSNSEKDFQRRRFWLLCKGSQDETEGMREDSWRKVDGDN